MPADLPSELLRMLGCGLTVAVVAAPVGLIAWGLARRAGQPLLPRPKPWRVPWTWLEVAIAFSVLIYVIPVVVFTTLSESDFLPQIYGCSFPSLSAKAEPSFEAISAVTGTAAGTATRDRVGVLRAVQGLWARMLSFPIQLGLVILAWHSLYRRPGWKIEWRPIPARVALGTITWAALAPIILAFHMALILVFSWLGWEAEPHPLSKLGAVRPLIDQILFFVITSATAPLMEEIFFRWILLGWLVGGRPLLTEEAATARRPISDARVWPTLLIALLFGAAFSTGTGWLPNPARGPLVFAVVLLLGWVMLRFITRKKRTLGAVYASAALFALVHSEVWPTPIPLFILGLGLGWLALRTRGILAPAIVHGLFNAVSVLFVLRSGPM